MIFLGYESGKGKKRGFSYGFGRLFVRVGEGLRTGQGGSSYGGGTPFVRVREGVRTGGVTPSYGVGTPFVRVVDPFRTGWKPFIDGLFSIFDLNFCMLCLENPFQEFHQLALFILPINITRSPKFVNKKNGKVAIAANFL